MYSTIAAETLWSCPGARAVSGAADEDGARLGARTARYWDRHAFARHRHR
jgi:hypothetical protein